LRPLYHFTARYWDDRRNNPDKLQEGWINDINGLFQLDGEYHLFAQRWWACWLHAVSTDLIHWEELQPAFGYEDDAFGGTASGGAVVDHDNTSGLATGEEPVVVAFWSSTDGHSQCIAFSNDRGRTWEKYADNPVLDHPCRDPKVLWHAPTEHWIMVLYTREEGRDGYTLFRSRNLLEWEKLHSVPDLFECPDLFELPLDGDPTDTRWVLVDGTGDYLVGRFDGERFTPETDRLEGDFGWNFYATMSWGDFSDDRWRRVQIAWVRRWQMDLEMPFNQQLSFPCDLALRSTSEGPRLCRWPIPEIRMLETGTVEVPPGRIEGRRDFDQVDTPGFDLEAEIDLAASDCVSFRFVVNGYPLVFVPGEERVNILGKSDPWPHDGKRLRLRILADRASLEVFLDGGRRVATHAALPVEARRPLSLVVEGGSLAIESLVVRTLGSMWADAPDDG